jgi:hypothetical protein
MGFAFYNPQAAPDTITSGNIVDLSILAGDLADNAVTLAKMADNAIGAAELADDAVDTSAIQNLAVTAGKIANNAITAAQVAANAIEASELADSAVDTAAIQNLAVTAAKVANDSLTAVQIAADAIGASELANDAVDTAAIVNLAVTAAKVANDTLTASQLAANAVGASELADNAVDTNAIQDAAVTAPKLAPGAVETAATADGSITNAKLAPDTVQAFTATGAILSSASGRTVTFAGASGQTLTLPAASVGERLTIYNIDTSDGVTIARATTDTIIDYRTTGATSFRLPAGIGCEVVCVAAGVWRMRYLGPVSHASVIAVPAATGNLAVTGVGFRPRVVEFTSTFVDTLTLFHGNGIAHADGTQWAAAAVLDGGGRRSVVTSARCILGYQSNGSAIYQASFVSMDDDGFTVNFDVANTNGRVGFIAHA